MTATNRPTHASKLRRGQMVEVRARREILATLDARGTLEGLPFQPEMLKFCGGTFRVFRRAEKVFLDHRYYVARLKHTVLLDDLRCDGTAHGGCRMGCKLLWKEAWLKPAGPGETRPGDKGNAPVSADCRLPVLRGDRYWCQATGLVEATSPLPWWDVGQYVRDLTSGDVTLRQFARMLTATTCGKLRRMLGGSSNGSSNGRENSSNGRKKRTPTASLGLQPGDRVEVKTRHEIEATLDADGKNRGLGFGESMAEFCGGRYRVAGRVDQIVLEWSGEMRRLANTVTLEGVACDGLDHRGCPRDCYHLWREIWLKRPD
jgi:hypothetical protein